MIYLLKIIHLRIYNEEIHLATKLTDSGTRELLEGILKEEQHIDWKEAPVMSKDKANGNSKLPAGSD